MSKGERIPCGVALDLVQPLVEALGSKARIAGSLRRGKETVGDVDIVIPRPVERDEVEGFGEWVQGGERKIRLLVGDDVKVQVDIVMCDPDEFGASLLYLTGPFQYNIKMRSHAKSMGLKLNEKGLWDGDRRVAGKTEREIYEALELAYASPAGRQDLKPKNAKDIIWTMDVPSSRSGQDPYKVTLRGDGTWHCPCRGFTYSKKKPKVCRHIRDTARPAYEAETAA